jgi:hypothetical protein
MLTPDQAREALTFLVDCPDGVRRPFCMIDPPDGSPPLPISERRRRLAQMLDEARCRPESKGSVAIYQQVLDGLDAFLREHGDYPPPSAAAAAG